jgi:hypothetical protein
MHTDPLTPAPPPAAPAAPWRLADFQARFPIGEGGDCEVLLRLACPYAAGIRLRDAGQAREARLREAVADVVKAAPEYGAYAKARDHLAELRQAAADLRAKAEAIDQETRTAGAPRLAELAREEADLSQRLVTLAKAEKHAAWDLAKATQTLHAVALDAAGTVRGQERAAALAEELRVAGLLDLDGAADCLDRLLELGAWTPMVRRAGLEEHLAAALLRELTGPRPEANGHVPEPNVFDSHKRMRQLANIPEPPPGDPYQVSLWEAARRAPVEETT